MFVVSIKSRKKGIRCRVCVPDLIDSSVGSIVPNSISLNRFVGIRLEVYPNLRPYLLVLEDYSAKI